MFCIKCGSQIPDNSTTCPNCGAQQTNQAQFNNGGDQFNNQYNNQYNNGYQGRPPFMRYDLDPQAAKSFKTLLICSIIELACCNQLFGGIALVLIFLGKSGYESGDRTKFDNYTKWATILLIIGVVLGLVCGVFAFGFGFLGELMATSY